MKENLLSAIKAHDFNAIRTICFGLSQEERLKLKVFFLDTPITQMYDMPKSWAKNVPNDAIVMAYAFMCLSDQREEILHFERKNNICPWYAKGVFYDFLSTAFYPELLALIQAPQGAYLKKELPQMYRENAEYISFEMLWVLYKMDLIPFNEKLFVENFYHKNVSYREEPFFIDLLLQYPEIATQILAAAPKYIYTYLYHTEYILAMYQILAKNNYFTNRDIVKQYLEALLNPWKKNILNAYCRWIEVINPTADEVIENQYTFFSLLSLGNTALINFAMKQLQKAANASAFDFQSFTDNFALCFATQKIAKSQLIGVEILEKHYQKQAPTNPDYCEQLAVLFTVPDAQLQEKVANLLTTYFNHEGLPEVIAPYRDYLKGKAQDLLATLSPSENSENSENSPTACAARSSHTPKIARAARTLTPITYPLTPEKLLFLIGDCIRERSPLVLDLFFEGLNQLQAQIPADFSKQISPYQKQLGEQPFEFTTYRKCMRWVIDVWEGKASLSDDIFGGKLYNPTPFLREKTKRLLLKIKQGNTLPFVSTPTHAPFYIDSLTFLERIAQYEKAGKTPMLEEVVVGLNRLLPTEITEAQKQLALSLTGEYAPALQYYFEVSKTITVTDTTRVLWGQVLRLKNIDGVFPELEIPQKPNLQGLVRPFYLKYEVKPTKINGVERNKIILEDNWDKKYSTYSLYNDLGANYYNVSPMSKGKDEDIDYGLSLNPRYIDGWLCKYLLTYAQGVEGESLTEATRVMSLLLQYNLSIYHGGWLMVATCLLSERKNLRDLATEYILLSLQKGETLTYLAEVIGTLLAHKYAPIARFIEFLDMPTRDPKIKSFQKAVVEAYLPLAEKLDKKPTNHKKLADWRM